MKASLVTNVLVSAVLASSLAVPVMAAKPGGGSTTQPEYAVVTLEGGYAAALTNDVAAGSARLYRATGDALSCAPGAIQVFRVLDGACSALTYSGGAFWDAAPGVASVPLGGCLPSAAPANAAYRAGGRCEFRCPTPADEIACAALPDPCANVSAGYDINGSQDIGGVVRYTRMRESGSPPTLNLSCTTRPAFWEWTASGYAAPVILPWAATVDGLESFSATVAALTERGSSGKPRLIGSIALGTPGTLDPDAIVFVRSVPVYWDYVSTAWVMSLAPAPVAGGTYSVRDSNGAGDFVGVRTATSVSDAIAWPAAGAGYDAVVLPDLPRAYNVLTGDPWSEAGGTNGAGHACGFAAEEVYVPGSRGNPGGYTWRDRATLWRRLSNGYGSPVKLTELALTQSARARGINNPLTTSDTTEVVGESLVRPSSGLVQAQPKATLWTLTFGSSGSVSSTVKDLNAVSAPIPSGQYLGDAFEINDERVMLSRSRVVDPGGADDGGPTYLLMPLSF